MAKDAKAQTQERLPRGSEPVGHQRDVPAILAHLKVVTWPNGHPRVAQPAIQQGRHLAHNFRRFVQGDAFEFFAYVNKGDLAVTGRSRAVADLPGGLQLSGFIAWMTRLFVHIFFLIGFRNKLVVLLN